MSSTEALQIIRENARKQFDPKIAELFARMIEENVEYVLIMEDNV
jgi:HD-GYP domain-containing protein (c-di-GMP phosphodiesterase class II)